MSWRGRGREKVGGQIYAGPRIGSVEGGCGCYRVQRRIGKHCPFAIALMEGWYVSGVFAKYIAEFQSHSAGFPISFSVFPGTPESLPMSYFAVY